MSSKNWRFNFFQFLFRHSIECGTYLWFTARIHILRNESIIHRNFNNKEYLINLWDTRHLQGVIQHPKHLQLQQTLKKLGNITNNVKVECDKFWLWESFDVTTAKRSWSFSGNWYYFFWFFCQTQLSCNPCAQMEWNLLWMLLKLFRIRSCS